MPTSFDFLHSIELNTILVNNNIYETFIKQVGNLEIPIFANTWFVESDSIFVVRFKEGVRFSDGSFVTDDDVLYSLNRTLHHPNSRFRSVLQNILSIEVRGRNVLVIHFKGNSNLITLLLNGTAIYKADYLRENDDEFLRNNPLSIGEYYLYSRTDDRITLKRNTFHRNYRQNRTAPNRVELIHVPHDSDQVQMLLNNEVDFIWHFPLTSYLDISGDKRFYYRIRERNAYTGLMLDAKRDISPGINLEVNPLRDKRVRHAIVHALDINSFIREQLHGQASPIVIPAMRYLIGYPDHLEYYRYDIEYSKYLLSLAGFPNGFDLSISITAGILGIAISDFIKKSLKKVNINVHFNVYEINNFRDGLLLNPPSAFIYTRVWGRAVTNILPPTADIFIPASPTVPSMNIVGNEVVHIVELLFSLERMSRLDSRFPEGIMRLAEYIYDEAMVIPLFQPNDISVINRRFDYSFPTEDLTLSFTDFKVRKR